MKRSLALFLLLFACKPAAQSGPAEVRLATDLSPAMIDTALQLIARNGGPRAERIAGAKEGAVYKPVLVILPKAALSDQVTSLNGCPFTVAMNCWV